VVDLTIDEEKRVFRILSNEWAQRYQVEHKRGPSAANQLRDNPQSGLGFLLENGFARAGGEQAGYGSIAGQALEESVRENESYDNLLQQADAPEIVWNQFTRICNQKGIGINQKINRGVVNGLVKLAQNSIDLNPFKHLGVAVITNPVDAFLQLRRIKGIGDKITSFFLRDIVTVLDIEREISPECNILFQPIDRWIQGMSKCLWPELENRAPPWLVAWKIVIKCKEYSCSSLRFNQGAWKYGSSQIVDTEKIPEGMNRLLDKREYGQSQ